MTPEHFNGLTPAEAERLALLIEECAEVIQAATKILRHGYESRNPLVADGESNRAALATELGHLEHAVQRMCSAADVNAIDLLASAQRKAERIARWLHHQEAQP